MRSFDRDYLARILPNHRPPAGEIASMWLKGGTDP